MNERGTAERSHRVWRRRSGRLGLGIVLAAVLLLGGAALGGRHLSLRVPWRPWSREPVSATADGRPVIVCLGDSLTAGDAAPPDQSYPAWLQRRLVAAGYAVQVVNAGVSGDRVADGLARLGADVLPFHPAVAIVELGSNDPGYTPPGRWAADLTTIVTRLQGAGTAVILGGLDEPGMGAVYRRVAARTGAALVWFTDGLWSSPGLWGDAHHPNGRGYRVVMEAFWPAVRRELGQRGLWPRRQAG